MQLATSSIVPMLVKASIELNLLEIMSKPGPVALFAPSEIASQLPIQNPDGAVIIERLLRVLASYSILTCKFVTNKDGHNHRLYGLAPVCKYLVPNEDGISLAPFLLLSLDKTITDSCHCIKEAILEGGTPFDRAHGMHYFEYAERESKFRNLFNQAMYSHTSIIMKRILEIYKGFEGLNELVDVGGLGTNLISIVSKYPHLKGVNFDLPHVIKDAPSCPGVNHIAGNMFSSVPKGEVIFMKWILHDWNDDQCLKILNNCYALPKNGKVIIVESIVPEFPATDLVSKNTFKFDMGMFLANPGGKERTKKEIEALAIAAGFADSNAICLAYSYWVIEYYKIKI
ncbi:LOW QUALITY PROTEIN: Methyltransf_2 domain-containing protein/Dimerisation domain-containing protein [Cephalotus follicularis]|uniref:caffeate O-methyltransferase n=1 Tax=Cephalotus follicularis TaxID=3775 RepID=A0A1Q3CAM6_CEPFO|nr:LOW QUALITY PROTEIN: Methyltransf_2 domain-containing protein/Dimerisation domain-containing protein [Cephalotus follicularis]